MANPLPTPNPMIFGQRRPPRGSAVIGSFVCRAIGQAAGGGLSGGCQMNFKSGVYPGSN